MLIEERDGHLPDWHGLCTGSTLTSVDDGSALVRLSNSSDQTLDLKAGLRIGDASAIISPDLCDRLPASHEANTVPDWSVTLSQFTINERLSPEEHQQLCSLLSELLH